MSDEHDTTPAGNTGDALLDLSIADAEALDALLEAGLDLERVHRDLRDRAQRVAHLLGLLSAGSAEGREARIARVLRAIHTNGSADLSGQDAEALDAWVLAGFDSARVPASLRERARAHEALAALVRGPGGPVSSDFEREDLIARTMAGIDRLHEAADDSLRFVAPAGRSRWTDFLSVAAVMLIGVSILWPVLSTVRDGARRTACESNLRTVARAMGAYTGDQDDTLPMATAGFGGGTWWEVGRDPQHSNSANLYTLARENYLELKAMACPGNPQAITSPRSPEARDWASHEELSYSYRVMARPEKELWGTPSQLVIVADRSPVIQRALRQRTMFPFEPSPNHRGRGQHALFADGSVRWLETPVLPSGDNIWLPKPIEMLIDLAAKRQGLDPLRGTEAPADRTDSFVGP
ncbi:MAG: hypothetical protein IT431_05310 [Phycisphaerales bacterium]|nr:hypothetical protein [Phycisphaerales bacterium]